MIRDLLLGHVPSILRVDVYATAALAGATLLIVARKGHVPLAAASLAGGVACIALRLLAASLHWQLPVPG